MDNLVYKKGQGWVYAPPVDSREVINCRMRYRIEFRKPEFGELYYHTSARWDWERWCLFIDGLYDTNFSRCSRWVCDNAWVNSERCTFITIVPCDA